MKGARHASLIVTVYAVGFASLVATPAIAIGCDPVLAGHPACAVYDHLPPGVQTGLGDYAAELNSLPTASLPDAIDPTAPLSSLVTGVSSGEDAGQPPIPPSVFVNSLTAWTGVPVLAGGTITSVWAGASNASPSLGMVVVATYDDSQNITTATGIPAPSPHGMLSIVSSAGSAILMQASDGTYWIFNPAVSQHITGA
jgi:hypothetical protein